MPGLKADEHDFGSRSKMGAGLGNKGTLLFSRPVAQAQSEILLPSAAGTVWND